MLSLFSILVTAWVVSAAPQCPSHPQQTSFSGKTLRIAAVGDSITVGITGSTYDGYRRTLQTMLDGNQVDFIGYHTSGIGRDPQVHAQSGDYISQMQDKINLTYSSKPNVYLIHAGSNNIYWPDGDCSQGSSECQDTANQLGVLVDSIHSNVPNALIVVAQVIPGVPPGTRPYYQTNTVLYNKAIEKMVRARDYPGSSYNLQLVNMQNATGGLIAPDDISGDGLHPNDQGYAKMAKQWYLGLANASYCNTIPAIQASTGYPTIPCAGSSGPFSISYNDGFAVQPRGVASFYGGVSCAETSSGTTCNCKDETSQSFTVNRVLSCKEMTIQYTSANRWADLNGDGRHESIWVGQTGLLNISLNLGGPTNNVSSSKPQTLQSRFRELGGFGLFAPSGASAKRYQVVLADLDGDARAEYCIIDPYGGITGYYNQGSMSTQDSGIAIRWSGTVNTVSGQKGVSGVGVRLVDWDGDGRADYVWVGSDGSVKVWLNKATNAGTATVTNWVAQGSGAVGPTVPSGTTRETVIFADVNADGRADYLLVNRSTGETTAYLNLPPASGSFVPQWSNIGIIVTAAQAQTIGGNVPFNEVVFADPDGDGAYDYLVVNGGDSSNQAWRNACRPWDDHLG